MTSSDRPTKKQRELLSFIDNFIKGTGYGPSYREIMRALEYKSVSTVAIHIDGLIARGYLRKRDNSARTLEVVSDPSVTDTEQTSHDLWLQRQLDARLKRATTPTEKEAVIAAITILEFNTSIDTAN